MAANLEPGLYRVRFMDVSGAHFEQYRDGGVTADLGVPSGIVLSGIDASLQAR